MERNRITPMTSFVLLLTCIRSTDEISFSFKNENNIDKWMESAFRYSDYGRWERDVCCVKPGAKESRETGRLWDAPAH